MQFIFMGLTTFSPIFLESVGCLCYPYEFFNCLVYLQKQFVDIFVAMTCKLLINLGRQRMFDVEFSIPGTWNPFVQPTFVSLRSILEFPMYNYLCFITVFSQLFYLWVLLKMDSSLPSCLLISWCLLSYRLLFSHINHIFSSL